MSSLPLLDTGKWTQPEIYMNNFFAMNDSSKNERRSSRKNFFILAGIAVLILGGLAFESASKKKASALGASDTKSEEVQNLSSNVAMADGFLSSSESEMEEQSQIPSEGADENGIDGQKTEDEKEDMKSPASKSKKNDSKEKKKADDEDSDKISLKLIINTGEKSYSYKKKLRKGINVLEVLVKTNRQEKFGLSYQNSSYGAFVESIHGVENDAQKNKYWMFEVNGKMSNVGASGCIVKDGDVIEWKYQDVGSFF